MGNPNSARARFKAHLAEHGEASAAKFGAEELGLKPGRIRRLIKVFTGQTATVSRAGSSERIVTMPTYGRYKPHVYVFNDKTLTAQMLKKGPEQSEVRFANGNVRIVSNAWITPIEEVETEGA